ncbi:type III PLP-dependent enzyme [Pseudooceanicola sp. 216_PA32_1]|uniref:ornithine decarboxylase n=1 Tax=Pseudooceanicola pacificus TaxID=2676438 RepID=A0A844W476_9RHOB|nr:type III PLP-dependent enzyme [Pseudooceanicola pacificus]MWB77611.1 type III PLP-dependent enzyme [Pseudooceanicola pacificus]
MRRDFPNADPVSHIRRHRPDHAQIYFCPDVLNRTARRFIDGFPGLVTYAVKANAGREVLENLAAAGLCAFDVASPAEMAAVREVAPKAALHYNNPVRSRDEIAQAAALGVRSWAIDGLGELDKIADAARGAEVSVRLALPVAGAAYDFGAKFGVGPDEAADLLREVARRGHVPALTFHPGTQCGDPGAWVAYVEAAAGIGRAAGVRIARLNVGGGFPAHRTGAAPRLESFFDTIARAVARAFGPDAPRLVCEPGRAMVAEAFTLATRVKAIRDTGDLFLNDGVYGGLSELRDIGPTDRVRVIAPDGAARGGGMTSRTVWGPTCDSLDRLPVPLQVPGEVREGDYLLFSGLGAYSLAISTRFNGYGLGDPVTVARL